MFRMLLTTCMLMTTLGTPSSAGNYSFTLDKIAVSTTCAGVKIDNKTYKYPLEALDYKGYTFSLMKHGITIFQKGGDAVVIDKASKKRNYKGWKRITVGHKTNVYVAIDRGSIDSPTGDAYLYSFYFNGHEVWCNYPPGPPPSFFSKIINTIKAVK